MCCIHCTPPATLLSETVTVTASTSKEGAMAPPASSVPSSLANDDNPLKTLLCAKQFMPEIQALLSVSTNRKQYSETTQRSLDHVVPVR